MTTTMLVRSLIALSVSLAIAPAALLALRRAQVLDHPSARSSHHEVTPRGGGVAPALGALVALAVVGPAWGRAGLAVGVAASVLGVIGLVEDVVGIRPLHRLGWQFTVAVLLGVALIADMTGPAVWRIAFGLGVVVWLVAFVNAFNFMDGINGISVAQAVAAGASWFLIGAYLDSPGLTAGGAIVAAAALGFAPYNVPRARMFLGDVGSYFLGGWLAAVAVVGLRAGAPPEAVLAPLLIYLADTGMTLVRRVRSGETWHLPHRSHVYQQLGDAGWSHLQVSLAVGAGILACGALGAVSLTGSWLARAGADVALAGVIVGYLLSPRLLTRRPSDLALA